jgi:hypothetical protein
MAPNNHMIGDYVYQDWLNLWFSHYLYDVDNHVLDMLPPVYAQDNLTGDYIAHDSWETEHNLILGKDSLVAAPPVAPFAAFSAAKYEYPVENEIDFFLMNDEEKEYYSELYGNIKPTAGIRAALDIIPPAAPLETAEERFTVINSVNGTTAWQNQLDSPTAGSTLYSLELPEDVTIKGVIEVNFRAAVESLGANMGGPTARHSIHARLAEVAAPGKTISAFGTNAVGATIGTSTVVSGGVFRGGGLSPSNIVRFNQATNLTYREIARGWMDLANPQAGYESYTAHIDKRIDLRDNLGVFHDYTLYLQPTVHTARQGNRLALIISFGHNSTSAYTGNNAFTVKFDNDASYISIPVVEEVPTTVDVNFPGVEGVSVEYYSAATSWVTVPGTYNDTCRFLLPLGVDMTSVRASKGGMSYQFDGLNSTPAYLSLDVPVISLMVFGIAADCDLAIVQNSWVYPYAPAAAGAPNYFNVFDNGIIYRVRLSRPGFYPIEISATKSNEYLESHGASLLAYFNNFYQITVPAGIMNVWMSSNDWIVRGAYEGDKIALLVDWNNIRDAKMTFVYNGETYTRDFKLDGKDPPFDVIAVIEYELINVKQTVVGGSYNFAAVNLLGANYQYEITSRPDTPGGAVVCINGYSQFAFNPQALPTNISRAGEYIVVAKDKSGAVVKTYKIIVE